MALNLEASLSSLSSELLMKVTQYLDLEELGRFDSAIKNKQLRTKFLVGVFSDTYLFPDIEYNYIAGSRWQQTFAQWLVLRRVFVRALRFDEETTDSARTLYDTINRLNPGLESLTILGKVDFPMDLAVRNRRTLSELVIRGQGNYCDVRGMNKFLRSMRELKSKGVSWKKLTFCEYYFDHLVVDVFGDTVTELVIDQCHSGQYNTPSVPTHGCTHLVWDIIHKCPNLQHFACLNEEVEEDPSEEPGIEVTMSNADIYALAKYCPNLETLNINSNATTITEKSVIYLAMKCTKLTELALYLKDGGGLTDAAVIAVAANLAHLQELELGNLQLLNPTTLRCIVHHCPQLKVLSLHKSNVPEAELVYIAQHAALDSLAISKQQQLQYPGRWSASVEHHAYLLEHLQLPVLGMEDVELLEAAQPAWLQRMQRFLQLPGKGQGTYTDEKLRAASSNPSFTVLWMGRRTQFQLNLIREQGSRSYKLILINYKSY
jgi:hypothetical protein